MHIYAEVPSTPRKVGIDLQPIYLNVSSIKQKHNTFDCFALSGQLTPKKCVCEAFLVEQEWCYASVRSHTS